MEPRGEGERTVEAAEIEFEAPDATAASSIRISGIPADLFNAPEKVRELMDLLELPEGTNANVRVTISSAIVR